MNNLCLKCLKRHTCRRKLTYDKCSHYIEDTSVRDTNFVDNILKNILDDFKNDFDNKINDDLSKLTKEDTMNNDLNDMVYDNEFFTNCHKCYFIDECPLRDVVKITTKVKFSAKLCPLFIHTNCDDRVHIASTRELLHDPDLIRRNNGRKTKGNESNKSGKDNNKFDIPSRKLEDLAGLDNIKVELNELVNMFKNKAKYINMGLDDRFLPKGLLLYGPPGCGKSTIAEALAGEIGANYIRCAGSEFVLKYVGVGAEEVRKLFKRARKNSPCIIFIDELDAIGVRRGKGDSKEDDKTLNQLLVEMTSPLNRDILIIGATNRYDMLDSALTRRGRFDRKIEVPLPDKVTRKKIIELNCKNKPIADDVDIDSIVSMTQGCCSSDLEGILVESVMIAVREGKDVITNDIISRASDRVVLGIVSDTRVTKEDLERIAVHECGHALVASLMANKQISKISILPRGTSLGLVSYTYSDDKYLYTKMELEESIAISLAGHIAESLFLGSTSSGCSNDFEKATKTAYDMVTRYGMSPLGTININLDLDGMGNLVYGHVDSILRDIELKVQKFIRNNSQKFHKLRIALLDKEELSCDDVSDILKEWREFDE